MEGSNGNGAEPEQSGSPEQPEQPTVRISTEITRRPKATMAEKGPDGKLAIEYVVFAEGEWQLHRYIVGTQGRRNILDAELGGLQVPEGAKVPDDLHGKEGN